MLEGVSLFRMCAACFPASWRPSVSKMRSDLAPENGRRAAGNSQSPVLVACDGGASFVRRTLNVPFEVKLRQISGLW